MKWSKGWDGKMEKERRCPYKGRRKFSEERATNTILWKRKKKEVQYEQWNGNEIIKEWTIFDLVRRYGGEQNYLNNLNAEIDKANLVEKD